MTQTKTMVIQPDVSFVRELMENGGETLKKCFQCGNCSVVCNISPDNEPFPRKEMIWAQWGLADRLIGNPDVWLCHQCNDCSAHCPRGANPGDVMAAVRNLTFKRFAPFGLGGVFASKIFVPLLFAIPAILIASAVTIAGDADFLNADPIIFSLMMPVPAIDVVFLPAVGFAAISALIGIMTAWRSFGATTGRAPTGSIVNALVAVVIGVLRHDKMGECDVNGDRTSAHKMLFYGFLALVVTTTCVALMYWINKLGIGTVAYTPLPLTHPVKILGNIGAILAFSGIFVIVRRRFAGDPKVVGTFSFYDSFFSGTLFWTIFTGIAAEVLRLSGIAILAYGVYYFHLVLVFVLLAYAPYSKFAHMFYRATALVWGRAAQRESAKPSPLSE
jgi:quinone-modifying oxidoreductase subunit QmoC